MLNEKYKFTISRTHIIMDIHRMPPLCGVFTPGRWEFTDKHRKIFTELGWYRNEYEPCVVEVYECTDLNKDAVYIVFAYGKKEEEETFLFAYQMTSAKDIKLFKDLVKITGLPPLRLSKGKWVIADSDEDEENLVK